MILNGFKGEGTELRRERRQRRRRRRRLLRRFLQWPPRLVELPPGYDPDGGGGGAGQESATERRECYMGLDDDVETMKGPPINDIYIVGEGVAIVKEVERSVPNMEIGV